MSNNGKGISVFSIVGLCFSIITPFLIGRPLTAYIGMVLPFVSLILSVIGIVDAIKHKKSGVLLGILGVIFSVLLIVFVITVSHMLIMSRLYPE